MLNDGGTRAAEQTEKEFTFAFVCIIFILLGGAERFGDDQAGGAKAPVSTINCNGGGGMDNNGNGDNKMLSKGKSALRAGAEDGVGSILGKTSSNTRICCPEIGL